MYLIFLREPCTKTVILRIQAYIQRETDRQTETETTERVRNGGKERRQIERERERKP